MPVTSKLLCAGLSDTGRARRQNEDRIHTDPERGIFIVADGLGGHAAGERAAETAVSMILARLQRQTGGTEERIREAIAVANNEIHSLANSNPEWQGMASVVTLAVVEDDQVTVGHVGDSRLYLLEPGTIRKITRDHSPVGELEDSGQLSEAAAMAHPRRNEVFRDLGSEPHGPHDEDFIEISRFTLRPDAAFLICSDGLSDQVTADRIRAIVEARARNPRGAVELLVKAANDAGGKDNVSVVLVEAAAYCGVSRAPAAAAATPRRGLPPVVWALAGFMLAAALFAAVRPYLQRTTDGWSLVTGTAPRPSATLRVGGNGAYPNITAALAAAAPGDTVSVAPGIYRENLQLKSGVSLLSEQRLGATIETNDVGLDGNGVTNARVAGFKVGGSGKTGIRLVNSTVEVTGVEVSGMTEAGVEIDAESQGVVQASSIRRNPGVGILIHGGAKPAIVHNTVSDNGPGRPNIEVAGSSSPEIAGNIIAGATVEQIWVSPLFNAAALAASNLIAPGVKDRSHLIKVVTR